jgi:hypothetical protein
MGNYTRTRWNHSSAFSAAHNAVAAAATAALSGFPPADLVARRMTQCPHSTPFKGLDSRSTAVVLDVPFGKRGSIEVRQWVKHIGGRWDKATKQWTLASAKCTPDAIKIINELRLYTGKTVAAPKAAFLPRIARAGSRIILQVPYESRHEAKSAGAAWSVSDQFWYFTVPQTLDKKFSEKIADFEVKGWVSIERTEREIIEVLKRVHGARAPYTSTAELQFAVPKDEAEARSKCFADPMPKISAPTAAKAQQVLPDEKQFIEEVLQMEFAQGMLGDIVATRYALRLDHANGTHTQYHILTLGRGSRVRISYLKGVTGADHSYMPKEDGRRVWDVLVKQGYKMVEQIDLTAAQLMAHCGFHTVGYGCTHDQLKHDANIVVDAREALTNRLHGRSSRLP